ASAAPARVNYTPVPTSVRTTEREELADYLVDLGAILASSGCPSYRLEDVIRLVADVEGQRAEAFALPTGLFLRVTAKDKTGIAAQRMARVKDWGVDLQRLTIIDEIFNDVISHKTTIHEARGRIKAAVKAPAAWSPLQVFVATVVASGAAAVFFEGGVIDI